MVPNSAINAARNQQPYQSEVLEQKEDRRTAQARYHEDLQAQIKAKETRAQDEPTGTGFILGNRPNQAEEAKRR